MIEKREKNSTDSGSPEAPRTKWERIFQAISHPTLILDPEHTIVMANDAVMEATGMSRDELVGKKCYEVFHASEEPPEGCPLETLKESDRMETEAMEMKALGGTYLVSCTPVFDDDGNLDNVIHIATDITKRKEAQQELAESEEKYRMLVERQGEGIGIVDADETFVFANPAAAEIFGVEEDGLVGQNLLDFLRQEQQDKVRRQTEQRKAGKESSYELEIIRPDGETRVIVVTVAARWDEDGCYDGAFGVFRDVTEQRRMQRQLKESEEKYRAIVEHSHDGIYIYRGTELLFVNDRVAEITGYTNEELYDMNPFELFHPDDRERVEEIGRGRAKGEDVPNTYQARVISKQGAVKYCEFAVTAITYKGEYASLGSVRDITEQKMAEEQLRQSEREKTLILDTSPALIAYQDTSHRVIWANRAAAESVGEAPEELEGRRCYEIWHQRGEPCESCPIEQAVETGEMQEGEITSPDGRHWLIRGSPVRDDEGNIVGAVETTLDITERKKAENKLRASEKRFEDIALSSADWIWEIDASGKYTFASGRVEQILGYAPEELLGKTPFEFMPDKEAKRVGKIFEKIVAGREAIVDLENWNLSKKGERVCLLTNGVPLFDDNGDLAGYRGVDKDITARKKAEKQYRNVVENAHDAIYIIHPEKGFEYVNPAFEEMTGYSAEEVCSKEFNFWDIIHPDDVKMIEERGKARERGEEVPERYEFRVIAKNGETKTFDVITVDIGGGTEVKVMGILRDVTKRKEAEEALKKSEEKYQSLFEFHEGVLEHSPAGILRLDDKLRIVYENPEMKELMGVPAGKESKAIGVDIRELSSIKEAGLAEILDKLLEGKEISGEVPFTSVYGKETYLTV